jgi:methylated-DNA-protein-cysteine methyltransferase-like protein
VFARLLEVVNRVPRGRVATYGQIARVAGLPNHARHVGWALHALPAHSPLPWHRVLGAGGAIRLGGAGGSGETQRLRLLREGVRFDARGRVPLERYGWRAGTGAGRGPAAGGRPGVW